MGSSFTRFRGHGFWVRDGALQVWLRFLAREADELPDAPDWLAPVAKHWHTQATYAFTGCMSAQLDDFLTEPSRVAVAERLAEGALTRLRQHGAVLSLQFLDTLAFDPSVSFGGDIETSMLVTVGERFIELLRGQLHTDASTSPVY